jgi:hypothetical protein
MPELDGSLEKCDSEVGEKMDDDENDPQGDAGFESVEAFDDVDSEEEGFRNTDAGPCGRVRGNAD